MEDNDLTEFKSIEQQIHETLSEAPDGKPTKSQIKVIKNLGVAEDAIKDLIKKIEEIFEEV